MVTSLRGISPQPVGTASLQSVVSPSRPLGAYLWRRPVCKPAERWLSCYVIGEPLGSLPGILQHGAQLVGTIVTGLKQLVTYGSCNAEEHSRQTVSLTKSTSDAWADRIVQVRRSVSRLAWIQYGHSRRPRSTP